MNEEQQITLDPEQHRAVELFCDATFGIITGGPGCGKTTILKQGLQEAQDRAQRNNKRFPNVVLATPTGKAACRLRDATGHQASTLHRLLGFGGGESYGRGDGLHGIDHVVVDEASMVDTPLLAALTGAIDPRYTRLTLVGDANQLPSVGPGAVLADLLGSGKVPTVELKTLHRAAQQSWVCRNAPRILAGELEAIDRTAPDFRFVRTDAGKVIKTLLEVLEDELNGLGDILGYDASQSELFDQSQIIVPQRVGTIGADALNVAIQNAVQGEAQVKRGGWKVGESNFLDGDKIIQTKNDYELGVMNGESGIVKGSTENGKKLIVRVDDRDVIMDRSQSATWRLGYAISVHKSQGSQWPLVIVICHSAQSRMLSRRLFYTAVTRASKRVVIIGDDLGFERAVRNQQDMDRKTQLGRLLAEGA